MFSQGSLILTPEGYTPIESLKEGDLVLTHLYRFRPIKKVIKEARYTINLYYYNITFDPFKYLGTDENQLFLSFHNLLKNNGATDSVLTKNILEISALKYIKNNSIYLTDLSTLLRIERLSKVSGMKERFSHCSIDKKYLTRDIKTYFNDSLPLKLYTLEEFWQLLGIIFSQSLIPNEEGTITFNIPTFYYLTISLQKLSKLFPEFFTNFKIDYPSCTISLSIKSKEIQDFLINYWNGSYYSFKDLIYLDTKYLKPFIYSYLNLSLEYEEEDEEKKPTKEALLATFNKIKNLYTHSDLTILSTILSFLNLPTFYYYKENPTTNTLELEFRITPYSDNIPPSLEDFIASFPTFPYKLISIQDCIKVRTKYTKLYNKIVMLKGNKSKNTFIDLYDIVVEEDHTYLVNNFFTVDFDFNLVENEDRIFCSFNQLEEMKPCL